MARCEVCGAGAEVHHIVNKCEGGISYPINYKYLCSEHHRGKDGPHKNCEVDIRYRLELQNKLKEILIKDYYNVCELEKLLHINKNKLKRMFKGNKIYKEGYKREDIIFKLMGEKIYNSHMLERYDDFIPLTIG
ncbi:HNH endonuclease signature motif containing protein [Clostridium tetani]|uniref:HNH endonuclease n=1 Tax=Clostridium tetani TaxID=1513 RepID=A0ABY0EQP7_CLOTA|nr:HNH endonuclease signature motif containing protein [Clostridium tetani]KHO32642.1 hypothetical protein OR62_12370 [Clostridium tetani]RXI57375.1 HNH endonuclease [Clostridium tetani]RXI66953.1 HNH endonuclease [Clostridium tetani]CDI50549.1 phage protein [Clostridium tetani 12124569]